MAAVVEKCRYFRNDEPYKHKTNRSPGRGRQASACQISPSYHVASRRSLETETDCQLLYRFSLRLAEVK